MGNNLDTNVCQNCHRSFGDLHTCKCRLKLARADPAVKEFANTHQILGFRSALQYLSVQVDGMSNERIEQILREQADSLKSRIDEIFR